MEAFLECEICVEPFDTGRRKPLVQPCGHTMCALCILRLRDGGRIVVCPTCRASHTIQSTTAAATTLPFPVNFTVFKLLTPAPEVPATTTEANDSNVVPAVEPEAQRGRNGAAAGAQHPECDMCAETYDMAAHKPMGPPCGHVICASCVTLVRAGGPTFQCPTCSVQHSISQWCPSVDAFPIIFSVLALSMDVEERRSAVDASFPLTVTQHTTDEDDGRTFTLTVTASDTVQSLFDKIVERIGAVTLDRSVVLLRGRMVRLAYDGRKTLADCNVRRGDTVHVSAQRYDGR